MAFVTGLLLIDAPASALNNQGAIAGAQDANTVGVKLIRSASGSYPYVSAQAFRYWLRETLAEKHPEWQAAPMFRETKVAYTDGNPILYWDDDLLGYMRAPSKRTAAAKAREEDTSREKETETTGTVTRVSPFRVGTLVSIAPVQPTEDFGVMSRHEGDPVPHVHQFYRATLKGLFSLDLRSAGTFNYEERSGYRNLDEERIRQADERGLSKMDDAKAYRLPNAERIERVSALLDAVACLEGGAKQTLHYTDVAPVVAVVAVTKGGNHALGRVVDADAKGLAVVNLGALDEALAIFGEEVLSRVYVGWAKGFRDDERARVEEYAEQSGGRVVVCHPRQALASIIEDLKTPANEEWLE